jgi:hypothetical protein
MRGGPAMAQRTRVYIVCSPHKRTGATTTARLLTDYFIVNGKDFLGFDTDPRDPDYGARFPEAVTVVDATRVEGQVALFDRLLVADETPKIVDVWHRSYATFMATIDEIGFMDEARRRMIQPIVLFHADSGADSLAAALALERRWQDLCIAVVTNKGAAPLGQDALDILARFPSSRRFVIGALDAASLEKFESDEFSVAQFLLAPPEDLSIVVRTALRAWAVSIFAQFRTFELQLAMEGAQFL